MYGFVCTQGIPCGFPHPVSACFALFHIGGNEKAFRGINDREVKVRSG